MELEEAKNILSIKGKLNTSIVKKAFFDYAQIHHPDKGGDPALFNRGVLAKDCLNSALDSLNEPNDGRSEIVEAEVWDPWQRYRVFCLFASAFKRIKSSLLVIKYSIFGYKVELTTLIDYQGIMEGSSIDLQQVIADNRITLPEQFTLTKPLVMEVPPGAYHQAKLKKVLNVSNKKLIVSLKLITENLDGFVRKREHLYAQLPVREDINNQKYIEFYKAKRLIRINLKPKQIGKKLVLKEQGFPKWKKKDKLGSIIITPIYMLK